MEDQHPSVPEPEQRRVECPSAVQRSYPINGLTDPRRNQGMQHAQLDLAVARAEICRGEWDVRLLNGKSPAILNSKGRWERFRPSTSWAHAGPIIEREFIGLKCETGRWYASIGDIHGRFEHAPLIAAMSVYVSTHAQRTVVQPKKPAAPGAECRFACCSMSRTRGAEQSKT
jgi:hypothetical protein